MQVRSEAELRKYLAKRVRRNLMERWSYNGCKFLKYETYFDGDYTVLADYTCTFKTLGVSLTAGRYPYERVIAEETFEGDNAVEECVAWVTDKLTERYFTTKEKLALYRAGYLAYTNVVNSL